MGCFWVCLWFCIWLEITFVVGGVLVFVYGWVVFGFMLVGLGLCCSSCLIA